MGLLGHLVFDLVVREQVLAEHMQLVPVILALVDTRIRDLVMVTKDRMPHFTSVLCL